MNYLTLLLLWPFGLADDATPESLGAVAVGGNPGIYYVAEVPRPHPKFDFYTITYHESTGICGVIAGTEKIDSNSSGTGLISAFKRLESQVSVRYGQGEFTNYLISGSIWDESNDFLMSLATGDRLWHTVWHFDEVTAQINQLSEVRLYLVSSGRSNGQVVLEYSGLNFEECDAAIQSDQSEVF